jgi:HTH-type transcriptional regulator, sugar sensing transcriptional regulator
MQEIVIIQNLGLSPNEAKVYLAFFGKSSFSATEIANSSGVSRTIIYRVLDSLMNRGLCSLIPGKIKRYKVSKPEVSFDTLIKEEEKKLQDAQNLLGVLSNRYEENSSLDLSMDSIEILKDPVLITSRYNEFLENTQKTTRALVKGPNIGLKAASLRRQAQSVIDKNKDKNIDHKNIYAIPKLYGPDKEPLHDERFIENELQYVLYADIVNKKAARNIRVAPELPLKATIFDGRYVMLVLPDPLTKEFSITTLIIDHVQLANGLTMLFDFLWEQSQPWDDFLIENNIVINETDISRLDD